MQTGLAIIKEEHRALAAVIHGLSYLVAEEEKGRMTPNFPLFRAIIHYITEFPDRLHHPKEEHYLFKAVRARSDTAEPILAQLEADHARQAAELKELEAALDAFERDGAPSFAAFADSARHYAESSFRHMAAEEGVLIPLALRVLTPEDWQAIDSAFQANNDPMAGDRGQDEFRALFTRIMDLAPPPLGFGDPRQSP